MLLGMDITFLETTAHKLEETPGGRYAKKSKMAATGNWKGHISAPIKSKTYCNTTFLGFLGGETHFWSHFKVSIYFLRINAMFCDNLHI